MRSHKEAEHGFTLVEVLVALIVTSLLLGVIMNGAISGRVRQLRGDERRAAIGLARAMLVEAAADELLPGVRTGVEGRLKWTLQEDIRASDPRGFHALVHLKIEVRNHAGVRMIDAETFKLKPVSPT